MTLVLSLLLSVVVYSRAQTRGTTTTIPPDAVQCGTEFCSLSLDEECVPEPYQCLCRLGYARSRAGEQCVEAVRFIMPLMVMRKNIQTLRWSSEYENTDSATYANIVNEFEQGIGQQFGKTSVKPSYITTNTLFINPPNFYNSSWQEGLMFNFSVALNKNHGLTDICDLWDLLVASIKTSNLRIGSGPLYMRADQPNVCPPPPAKCGNQVCDAYLGQVCINNRVCDCPAGRARGGPGERCQSTNTACLDNDCHPLASCIETGPNSYTCRCPDGFLDAQETINPGRTCVRPDANLEFPPGVSSSPRPDTRNECERAEWNECHVHAMCYDLTQGYECRCLPDFMDVSAPGSRPGTACMLDYCADILWCPQNTTCVNREREGDCVCLDGFLDLRASDKRASLRLEVVVIFWCLHPRDVDECALALTDCSGIATCVDQVDGYDCECPVDFIDGSPQNPGRICGICGLCNFRGSCVHDVQTQNVTCACHDGYSGAFCEVTLLAVLGVRAAIVSPWVKRADVCDAYRCPPNHECWPETLHSERPGVQAAALHRSYCAADQEAVAVCNGNMCPKGTMCGATLRVCQNPELRRQFSDICLLDYVCFKPEDFYEDAGRASIEEPDY